jgi:hypothetical protein
VHVRSIARRPPGDRRRPDTNVRVALVGLIGAVIAAIIAAIIGGVYLLHSTRQQVASSQADSQRSFMREQQQKAYTDFIAKDNALRQVEARFFTVVGDASAYEGCSTTDESNGKGSLWKDGEDLRPGVVAAVGEFEQAIASVRLLGSPDAVSDAESVRATELLDPLDGLPSDEALLDGCPDWPKQAAAYRDSENSHQAAVEKFENAARADLGGVPLMGG